MSNDFKHKNITSQLADFSNIDINDININAPLQDASKLNHLIDENGFFNNLEMNTKKPLKIKILGIGGAGNNMVAHMAQYSSLDPQMLFAVNTDQEVLYKMKDIRCSKVLIGKHTTAGYGSGSNPEIGQQAAIEDQAMIRQILTGVDVLFIVSGMGKGTGTGASPVVAEIAQQLGILTIAIVNIPSIKTEGKPIYDKGLMGTNNLKKYVNGLATINNDSVLGKNFKDEPLYNCFNMINQVISDTVSDLITTVTVPTVFNIDFNDVKNFFKEKTSFQITNCEMDKYENSKETLKQKLAATLFEDNLVGSKKAILSLRTNHQVPANFLSEIREVLEEITNNPNLELTYSMDYSDDIEFAKVSVLVATGGWDGSEEQMNSENQADFLIHKALQNNSEEVLVKENMVEEVKESSHSLDENPNAFISDVLNKMDNMASKGFENQNPLAVNENNEESTDNDFYNLDDIGNVKTDFTSIKEEIQATRTKRDDLSTKNLSSNIKSNQAEALNSTILNRFVDKTLQLFRSNNNSSKDNDQKF